MIFARCAIKEIVCLWHILQLPMMQLDRMLVGGYWVVQMEIVGVLVMVVDGEIG